MKKYLPRNKPEINEVLARNIKISQEQKEFLGSLSESEKTELFFTLLQDSKNVSNISTRINELGFDQNNIIFQGETKDPGDQLSICRWVKAASGSLIIPMRYGRDGQLKILFGYKENTWVLPGGHYELDEHRNLDHTFVAELMEETGIVPNIPEFQKYIEETLIHAKNILPYDSIISAGNYVSNRFTWNLETVLSGAGLGYGKRIILAVYSIVFHDGDVLKSKAADDLEKLEWFSVSQILSGDSANNFKLSNLIPAHYEAVQYILSKNKL